MLSTFTLLIAAGAGCRLVLSRVLRRNHGLTLQIPQGLAVLMIGLACLPSWASPVVLPVSLGFVLGVLLPDLVTRRS